VTHRLISSLAVSGALVLGLAAFAATPQVAHATTTFVVNRIGDAVDMNVGNGICDTSTNTGRQCTLRAAIQEANVIAGEDTINFNITSTSKTIAPNSRLPAITERVTINGYGQSGASQNTKAVGSDAVLKVVLDGVNAGARAIGLRIDGDEVLIKGLVIQRWDGAGISVTGSNSIIAGNFIGTTAGGGAARANRVGILLGGSANTVGGIAPAARNLISGNTEDGISGDVMFEDDIVGNYIGTTKNGSAALGNQFNGIHITNGDKVNIGGTDAGAGNLISGNGRDGIVADGIEISSVRGNFIGTDAAGTQALGNIGRGVRLLDAHGNDIGGTVASARNVTADNLTGIEIAGDGNAIQGNRIGTKADGSGNLGNRFSGIVVSGNNNLVGGTGAAGNVSSNSKNEDGIYVSSGTGNVIQGNALVNNALDGVHLFSNVDDSTILANTIVGNGRHGIYLGHSNAITSTGILISANILIANGGLGIQLDGFSEDSNGVTLNDSGDGDMGPNNQQNFPVLNSAQRLSNGITVVSGSLNSLASTDFRIELFLANPDPSGHGEAQAFLAFKNITTNSAGNKSFSFSVAGLASGMQLSSTAIRDSNGDTSEFSANVAVVNAP
jgi:CSLREA domain-containing protein